MAMIRCVVEFVALAQLTPHRRFDAHYEYFVSGRVHTGMHQLRLIALSIK